MDAKPNKDTCQVKNDRINILPHYKDKVLPCMYSGYVNEG